MSTKPGHGTPDHEAIPLSVREGPVDLNAENYRLRILRHDRTASSPRDDEAEGAHPTARPSPDGG